MEISRNSLTSDYLLYSKSLRKGEKKTSYIHTKIELYKAIAIVSPNDGLSDLIRISIKVK
jgi:hypothetical protein